jgi:osmotically-inducible protein OsmY
MILSSIMNRVAYTVAAVALAAGLAACAMGPPRTDAQKQSDKEVADRVLAALDADKQLYAKHIWVRSDNGVVRLSGFVWDPPDILEAEDVAGRVEGVNRVVNDLELERNGIDDSPVTY